MAVRKLSCDAISSMQMLMAVFYTFLNKQTPEDLSSPSKLSYGETFDFIIAGGGTAGCVLANRLTEVKDWTVLVLEAGGEEPYEAQIPAFGNNLKDTSLDWQYLTEPQETSCAGKPCKWPRGKVLGGSSSINDMIYNRGNKYDFDHWAELGNTGWDYEDGVLPYFKKSENNHDPDIVQDSRYHSIDGYQDIGRFPYVDENIPVMIKGFQELGYKIVDFNGPEVLGVAHLQGTQYKGERRSTNRAFLEPIRYKRPNIKVVTNVRVTKVLIDETKTAYGVEYFGEKDRSIHGKVYATIEVIVSCGSINSPQLLLLSGIGPRDTLESLNIPVIQDLKVGYNLHDHVGAFAVKYFVGNSTRPKHSDIFKDAILYSMNGRTGPWSGIGCLSLTAYVNSRHANKSIDFPDVQFSTIPSISDSNDPNFCEIKYTLPWCYYNRITFMPAVMRPKSMGYLTINSSDPFARPLMYPNSFYDKEDLEVIIDGFKAGVKLADTEVFKEHGFTLDKTSPQECAHLEFGSDEYWACAAMTVTHSNYHPVGTCKMGPSSDPEAVVDPKLRVYGVKNLRVIDSSIMPLVTSGNTNAPSIMIGEKGADLVKESYEITL